MYRAHNRIPTAAEFTSRLCLTVIDLSRGLGRSPRTIKRMVDTGKLPPRRKIARKRLG